MEKVQRFSRRKVDKVIRHLVILVLGSLVASGIGYSALKEQVKNLNARVHLLQRMVCSDAPEAICKGLMRNEK